MLDVYFVPFSNPINNDIFLKTYRIKLHFSELVYYHLVPASIGDAGFCLPTMKTKQLTGIGNGLNGFIEKKGGGI